VRVGEADGAQDDGIRQHHQQEPVLDQPRFPTGACRSAEQPLSDREYRVMNMSGKSGNYI